ncbi:hypothetical protein [Thioalkalivibrio sulfidiphilus]|uniref:hypothetical protein n=1 Tax=Thioalkalivibrio sulfidiphilus TaxID=1033854 RepID=UPI00059B61B4|nr:hypothetical protein [Thioalkalivibrio sulfidiphilus]
MQTQDGAYTTTQSTAKSFKALQAIGVTLILFGSLVLWIAGANNGAWAAVLLIAGLGLVTWAKLGSWWQNG